MSSPKPISKEERFDWPLCYEAENFILHCLAGFTERNRFARRLQERMRAETGTLLLDWVDHLVVAQREEKALRALGFVDDPLGETPAQWKALWHPEAMLPRVLLQRETPPAAGLPSVVAIRCEALADFIVAKVAASGLSR